MAEKILRIEECNFKKEKGDWSSFEGFQVVTDKQTIKFGIGDHQSCCENWGCFITNDNIDEFIGAKVFDVKITDDCLIKEKAPDIYEGGVMYVDIETNKGIIQFTAYNGHNGYYSHEAVLFCKQKNESEYL